MVVAEDDPVDLPPGAGDELGLGLGLGQCAQEFGGRRQDAGLDDIDVGSSLHGRGKLLAGVPQSSPRFNGRRFPWRQADALLRGKKRRAAYP